MAVFATDSAVKVIVHKDNRFTKDELTTCQLRNFTEVSVSLLSVWGTIGPRTSSEARGNDGEGMVVSICV